MSGCDDVFSRGLPLYSQRDRRLSGGGLAPEAIPLLEKALELDPDFAQPTWHSLQPMATWVSYKKQEEYRHRAVDDANRLALAYERYLIEGSYYALKEETYHEGFRDSRETVGDSTQTTATRRNNLALRYTLFERFDEGI